MKLADMGLRSAPHRTFMKSSPKNAKCLLSSHSRLELKITCPEKWLHSISNDLTPIKKTTNYLTSVCAS